MWFWEKSNLLLVCLVMSYVSSIDCAHKSTNWNPHSLKESMAYASKIPYTQMFSCWWMTYPMYKLNLPYLILFHKDFMGLDFRPLRSPSLCASFVGYSGK